MALPIESDLPFATTVGGGAAPLVIPGAPGAGSNAVPYLLPVGATQVLLAAGRATSAIPAPVPAIFNVSAAWAIVRWFWAFQVAPPAVVLGGASRHISAHHRSAFTEALGLAAGLLVVEQLLGGMALPVPLAGGGPLLVDVDSQIGTGVRPDLVIYAGPPSPATPAFILECKGNSTGRAASIAQLRTGVVQTLSLPSAALPIPGPITRVVVGVAAPRPPNPPAPAVAPLVGFAITLARSVNPANPPAGLGGAVQGGAPEEAAALALDRERSRLLRFAGEEDYVEIGQPGVFEVADYSGETIEVSGRRFVLRGADMRVELTIGVERRVLDGVRTAEAVEELTDSRGPAVERSLRRGEIPEQARPSLVEAGSLSESAADGCVLGMRAL